jgi:hypothetical protein
MTVRISLKSTHVRLKSKISDKETSVCVPVDFNPFLFLFKSFVWNVGVL